MASVEPAAPPSVSVATTAKSALSPSETPPEAGGGGGGGMAYGSSSPSAILMSAKKPVPPHQPMETTTTTATPTPESACSLLNPTEVSLKPENPSTVGSIAASPLKRPRHKPGERKELLLMAVNDVIEHNISMRKAASRYNLAKSSLCDFVRKNGIKLPNNRCKPSSSSSSAAAAAASASGGASTDHQAGHSRAERGEMPALFGLPAETMNLLRAQHAATPPAAATSFSRLQSPWNNVSGLPTQVPMQNWSSQLSAAKSLSATVPHSSAAPSPKQSDSMVVNAESNSPSSASSLVANNGSHHQLPATSVFAPSSFICTPVSAEALDSIATTTPFFPPAAPPSITVTHFPAPNTHVLPAATGSASDPAIPTPLSRSLASIYAPTALPTSAASSQIPLVFPANPVCSSDPSVVDSLQSIILAAARGDGKQLLSANLGDLLNLPMNFPPDAASCLPTPAEVLLRKLQIPNCLNSLIGGAAQAVSQTSTTAPSSSSSSSVMARLPQSPMSHAKELINFINKSPSPFHVVRSACEILANNGFRELLEYEPWKLEPNDCVFVTKNHSSLFAVAVGGAYKPGEGFGIIGAHTDSPCLRLKPISERTSEGFVELAVQTYGGGLWYTWFDRELTLAGRCLVRNPTTGALEQRLVHIARPLACVPSLAIHLNREVNKSFAPNPEVHLAPILCTTLTEQLHSSAGDIDGLKESGASRHPASLLRLIAAELQCAPSDLVELELYLADTQPARIGGIHEEFIHAPRLDNQFCSYTSIQALVNSLPSLKEDSYVRVVCLYDHEEIGSRSTQGANSLFTESLFRRITDALSVEAEGGGGGGVNTAASCLFERTMARSFILSADQAHAVHPSWPEKHEPAHKPTFHHGIVLKHHCSQNYATNGLTSAIVKEVARRCQVPLQEFVIRQDQMCGSTIGPIVASHLGVMTADVGGAQLAMHSCREMTCTTSVGHAIAFFTGFFEHLPSILAGVSFK
uniref:Aspartyl aminopeptidase n=2 Tax=Mesocestoides corti TaxID=53468 RepID=A0A5K3F8B4_MESCO